MENLIEYTSNEYPQLSVVIPTYEGHHAYLQEAVNSVGFNLAEIIIVNDSDTPLDVSGDHIYVINRDTPERWGTGKARNIGGQYAHTDLLLWLDSDDVFVPNGVKLLYDKYIQTIDDDHPYGKIVYGGLLRGFDNAYWAMKPQYCGDDIRESGLMTPAMPYCILIPKVMHELIGGYDEDMITWEDVDYEKKITVNGLCAEHIHSVIFWYRWESGKRRDLSNDQDIKQQVSAHMYAKYKEYHEGRKKLGNCATCGQPPKSPYKPVSNVDELPTVDAIAKNEILYLVYIGTDLVHTVHGPVTNIPYRIGKSSRKEHYRKRVVDKTANLSRDEINRQDAEELIQIKYQGRFNLYKYEVEVVVGDAPIPLPPRKTLADEIANQIIGIEENDNIGFIFEAEKAITEYTIGDMKALIKNGEVFKSQLQTWLEQEGRLKNPRKGMIKLLDETISTI